MSNEEIQFISGNSGGSRVGEKGSGLKFPLEKSKFFIIIVVDCQSPNFVMGLKNVVWITKKILRNCSSIYYFECEAYIYIYVLLLR